MQMYAGKEQRSDLIKELRTTHALQSPEQCEKKREKEEITRKQAHKLVSRIDCRSRGTYMYVNICHFVCIAGQQQSIVKL